jgi:hypothetical protein
MKFRPNADIMASVLVHLLLLALIFLYSEVQQFDPVAADTMPVEVVTQQEAAEVQPDPVPSPSPTPDFQLPSLDKPAEHATPEPAAQAPAQQPPQKQAQQPPQKSATPPAPQPQQKQATLAPQPALTPQQTAKAEPSSAPQTSPPSAQQPPPAFKPPEPDVSVKYGVMLGLPPYVPTETPAAAPAGNDNFDAPATEKADIGTGVVAQFRQHLKTCMKLPANLNTGDDVRVKLRVRMTPDGTLASPPQLIEATASAKGPLLMKSATSALQACQPYGMLPKERYGEWKALDLDFTPRDFGS